MADEDKEARPSGETSCPSCGKPAERGQLVCLECGGRIALDYRRPYGWKLPLLIVALALLLVGAGSALALQAVDDDAAEESAQSVGTVPKAKPAAGKDKGNKPAGRKDAADKKPAREKPKPKPKPKPNEKPKPKPKPGQRAGAVGGWPKGKSGFTVVIGSTEDQRSAAKFAREARTIEVPAGVLDADKYAGLGMDLWIVFAGVYDDRAEAEKAVADFSKRYPGAYPQAVKPL